MLCYQQDLNSVSGEPKNLFLRYKYKGFELERLNEGADGSAMSAFFGGLSLFLSFGILPKQKKKTDCIYIFACKNKHTQNNFVQ